MASSVLVSTAIPFISTKANLLPLSPSLLSNLRKENHPLILNKSLQLVAWTVSEFQVASKREFRKNNTAHPPNTPSDSNIYHEFILVLARASYRGNFRGGHGKL